MAAASQGIGAEHLRPRNIGNEATGYVILEHDSSGGGEISAETHPSSVSHPTVCGASRHPRQRGAVTWGSVDGRKGSGDVGKRRPRSRSPLRGGYADGGSGGSDGDRGGDASGGAEQNGGQRGGGSGGAKYERCNEDLWQIEYSRGGGSGGWKRAEEGSHCSRVRVPRNIKCRTKAVGHGKGWEGPGVAMPDRDSIRRMEAVRRGEEGGPSLIGGVKSRRRGYLQGERYRARNIIGARGGLGRDRIVSLVVCIDMLVRCAG